MSEPSPSPPFYPLFSTPPSPSSFLMLVTLVLPLLSPQARMADEPEHSDPQPADLEAAQAQLPPQQPAAMQAPTQALQTQAQTQAQAPSPGQQVVMLALKVATLVPHTVQLSFCLDPSWGKIP